MSNRYYGDLVSLEMALFAAVLQKGDLEIFFLISLIFIFILCGGDINMAPCLTETAVEKRNVVFIDQGTTKSWVNN